MSKPRVVIITDRTWDAGRLAEILGHVPRGSVAIQIRDKALDGGPLLQLARDVLAIARPAGALVWVNDRVDLALIVGADGVHLPEDGLALADARRVAPALALGASRHSEASALAAATDGAAIVQLGPIFATPGKEPVGTGILAVRAQLPQTTRIVAVGGIDSPARVREVAAAGADAIAVIRAAWTADDPAHLIDAMIAAFDIES